jgi:deazaflavin-dependent oxidoreductase (nitroreductase family)
MGVDPTLVNESYCYLTTTGRVSGESREIEVWFGLDGKTLYMLSGGGERSDWVKNLMREPRVSVKIGEETFPGRARIVNDEEEDARARRLLLDKYSPGYSGDLSDWGESALPVAVDLGGASRAPPIGSRAMDDLGPPASYLILEGGTRVVSSDGAELGKVGHVLADPNVDVFDGIVLDTDSGGRRFIDASQIDEIYERGVVLSVDAAAAERLPEPSANPGGLGVGPDDMVPDELRDKLRRAWDRISGKE